MHPQRNSQLDILRFIAVFMVIGHHSLESWFPNPGYARFIFQTWIRGGWVSVDLFFVLSGYLVSSLIFKEHQKLGKVDLKTFYIRRAFKILPPFYVYLFFCTVFLYLTKSLSLRWVPVDLFLELVTPTQFICGIIS